MARRPTPHPSGRLATLSLVAALWLGFAAPAVAEPPEAPAAAAARSGGAEEWKGRFCTAGSCRDRPASPIAAAASFGAAIFAVRWLARRPSPQRPRPDSD